MISFLPPSAPAERRWALDRVAEVMGDDVAVEPELATALDAAERDAATVLVCGSFHTVGDAMARLPGFPPLG